MSNKLAIVGGTGAVGRVFIEYLKTHELPIDEIKIVARIILYFYPLLCLVKKWPLKEIHPLIGCCLNFCLLIAPRATIGRQNALTAVKL